MYRQALLLSLSLFCLTPLLAEESRDFNFPDPLRPFNAPSPLTPAEEARERLHLQAIVMTGSRGAYAVINSQPVGVGDEVDGYRILQIHTDNVLLGRNTDDQPVIIQPHSLTFDSELNRSEP